MGREWKMPHTIFRKWESFQWPGTGTEWWEKLDHKYSHNTICATIVNFELSIVLNSSRVDLNTPWCRFHCCLSGCNWPEYFSAGILVWEKQVRTSVSRRAAAMCICRRRGRRRLTQLAGASVEELPPLRQNAPTHKVAILVPSSRRNCLLPGYSFKILHLCD